MSTTTTNPATFSEVINAVAGQQQVRFKWTYIGSWDYYWDIDNASITGKPRQLHYPLLPHQVLLLSRKIRHKAAEMSAMTGEVQLPAVVLFEYGRNGPSLGSNLGFTINGNGTGQYNSAFVSLSAATTYYVRAYATNSSGTAYGNQLSFTTTSGGAQLRLPFTENFNSAASLPNGWEIVDHEGHGQVWGVWNPY